MNMNRMAITSKPIKFQIVSAAEDREYQTEGELWNLIQGLQEQSILLSDCLDTVRLLGYREWKLGRGKKAYMAWNCKVVALQGREQSHIEQLWQTAFDVSDAAVARKVAMHKFKILEAQGKLVPGMLYEYFGSQPVMFLGIGRGYQARIMGADGVIQEVHPISLHHLASQSSSSPCISTAVFEERWAKFLRP